MVSFMLVERSDVKIHIIHSLADDRIPFCEYFIIPYVLWYFFLIGTVIYLKVSEKELESRLGSLKERGVVSNGKSTVEEIFEDRKRLYEKYADITIVQEGRDIRMIVEDMYKKLTKLI